MRYMEIRSIHICTCSSHPNTTLDGVITASIPHQRSYGDDNGGIPPRPSQDTLGLAVWKEQVGSALLLASAGAVGYKVHLQLHLSGASHHRVEEAIAARELHLKLGRAEDKVTG